MKFVSEIKSLHFYNASKKKLCSFVDGIYETDDKKEISLLLHKVPQAHLADGQDVGVENASIENVEPPTKNPDALLVEELEKMSLKQLKEYCDGQKIELPKSVQSKAAALKVIEAAQAKE